MSKIFTIGDLHSRPEEMKFLNNKNFPEQKELTKEDVLVQLGDFGWIWYFDNCNTLFRKDEKQLDILSQKNYTLFVIPGNHDNYDRINNLPKVKKWGGYVYQYTSLSGNYIYFALRGEVYLINGKTVFTFSGAATSSISDRYSYEDYLSQKLFRVKKYDQGGNLRRVRPEKIKICKVSYWKAELASDLEKDYAYEALKRVDFKVDYVFTHTAPVEIIGEFISKTDHFLPKFECDTAVFLSNIFNLIQAKEWHFGHLHTTGRLTIEDILFECHYMNAPKELI